MSEYAPCHVSEGNCSAPANLEGAHTKGKCFACGESVCTQCSSLIRYMAYGRRRICFRCIEDYSRGTPQETAAEAHIYRRLNHPKERGVPFGLGLPSRRKTS